MMLRSSLLLLLVWTDSSRAFIGEDGICNIHALVPFSTPDGNAIFGLGGNAGSNEGYVQLAAALLAVRHFNSRNATVVPEIANMTDCTVTLNISKVFNGARGDNSAIRWMDRNGPPDCAIVGPSDDETAIDLTVIAKAHSIPLVTTKTFDISIVSDGFTSSVYPDLVTSAKKIVEYLHFKKRDNFVAFLYELNGANFQRREAIAIELDNMGMKWMSTSFGTGPSLEDAQVTRSAYAAMKQIKDSGYRTIVIAQSNPWGSYQQIADAAEALAMNRGGHFYVWYDEFEPSIWRMNNANITKISAGSAWIMPPPLRALRKQNDPFSSSWLDLGNDFVDIVQAYRPVGSGPAGRGLAGPGPAGPGPAGPGPAGRGPAGPQDLGPNFFQTVTPEFTAAQIYDATISIGIGACRAQVASGSKVVNGSDHLKGIREATFQGSTGRVEFGIKELNRLGSRRGDSIYWTAINIISPPANYTYADWINPTSKDKNWVSLDNFVYADGTTTPPALLRDTPEQNYLSVGLQAVGFTLMGITMATAIICAGWVFIHRHYKIVTASQPEFLYLICFGALVESSAILPASFDESSGWSTEQLNEACMATPWLAALGYTIVYCSLFTKLWRVNKVLQFTRRKIEIRHVAWPMAVLLFVELLILVLWTVLDPLVWKRVEINSTTGESIGSCNSDDPFAFVIPLIVVMLIPSTMTLIMAWKTRDVDDTFSESRWIFILTLLQIEVAFIAVPVIVMLQFVSADGRYLGMMFLFWLFPTSTLGLIFFPKIAAYRRSLHGNDATPRYKRGERTRVRVSGHADGTSVPASTGSQKIDSSSVLHVIKSSHADVTSREVVHEEL